jgi:hypothetical protein
MAACVSAGVIGLLGEAVGRFILSQIDARAEVCSLFRARYTSRRRRRRHRACWEGSWEGGGSLVGVGDSIVPWEGDVTCQDGIGTMVWCNLWYIRQCGVIFTAGTQRLVILASQLHGEVLPPCDCEARIASMM